MVKEPSPVRILWLTKGLGLGGAERLLTLLASGFDRDRYEIEVAYLLPWKDAFVPELEAAGARMVCLGARRTLDARWVLRLCRLLRQRPYALVHTHSPVPAVAARLLAPRGTALVHTEHNVWDRYRWATRVANATTYGRNDAVVAVSEGVADSVVPPRWALGRAPEVRMLHHGVDAQGAVRGADARTEARARLGLDPRAVTVGTVATFTPKKDHAGLIAAFERIRAEEDDARLLLIGTGPLEDAVRAEVSRRGLEREVMFLGPRMDVLSLLPALDVFVLGSRFEGLPISLLEAMAAEVACVATRVGGIPEAITDGVTGRLVPPGDPGSLAAAVLELLQEPERRAAIAASGRERVRSGFSITRAATELQSIYTETLRAAGHGT